MTTSNVRSSPHTFCLYVCMIYGIIMIKRYGVFLLSLYIITPIVFILDLFYIWEYIMKYREFMIQYVGKSIFIGIFRVVGWSCKGGYAKP